MALLLALLLAASAGPRPARADWTRAFADLENTRGLYFLDDILPFSDALPGGWALSGAAPVSSGCDGADIRRFFSSCCCVSLPFVGDVCETTISPFVAFPPGWNGVCVLKYPGSDGSFGVIEVTVTPVNSKPTASSSLVFETDEGAPATVDISQGASFGPPDESGQAWAAVTPNVGASTFGTVAASGTNRVTFTPAAGFAGTTIFSFTLTDNGGTANGGVPTSDPATATVRVKPLARVAAAYTCAGASPLEVAPADGLLLVDGEVITDYKNASLVAGPPASEGAVVVGADGGFTFTPAAGFVGPTSFTHRAASKDGSVTGDVQTATIKVLPPAQDRTYPASSSADLFVQPEQGLLSTSDGDVPPGVRVVVEAPPARGKLQMGGDGGFKFSPTSAAGSRGPDSFTYRTEATAADGSIVKSATKTVTLDIGAMTTASLAPPTINDIVVRVTGCGRGDVVLERFSATAGTLTVIKGKRTLTIGAPKGLLLVLKRADAGAWSESNPASLGVDATCQFPVPISFKAGATRKVGNRRYPKLFLCLHSTSFTCGTKYVVRAQARLVGKKFASSGWVPKSAVFILTPICDAAATAACKWGPPGSGR